MADDNSAGRIIFLNGPSCAGKTTIAYALQDALDEPYLHLSVDRILDMLPEKNRAWNKPENYRAVYKAVSGMHHCAATFAATGNNVIVDTVLTSQDNLVECVYVLAHFQVTFVGVFCPLEELERRAKARTDRQVETVQAQFKQVHAYKLYDIEVDTAVETPEQIAAKIKAYDERVAWPQAFRQMRNERILLAE